MASSYVATAGETDRARTLSHTLPHAEPQLAQDGAKASAKDAADKARKASAYGALWLFVSLLLGAFVASLCATWGGRMRDA
jgi:hypothetical protein